MTRSHSHRMPTVFVIFGASGDLMRRKIVSSLYHLYRHRQLPPLFSVIGFSRPQWSDVEFRDYVHSSLKDFYKHRDDKTTQSFLRLFHYQQGLFEERSGFLELAKRLGHLDRDHQACSNKLYYLAVPPQTFAPIFRHLKSTGLTLPCGEEGGWTRVLVEKPFGEDFKTAMALERLLGRYFSEEQIYRIDHYLAKEMLQGIIHFRFSNNLLEPSWNNQSVESIEISLLETIGVEERGAFYDRLGALRDVGQNHLLQMLALITMDHPGFEADSLRHKRAEILKTLKPWRGDNEIKQSTFRGQYHGYRKIEGVKANSKTETYFKIKTSLTSPRWQGVPITMESGKRLKDVKKEIVVNFKHPSPCFLCPPGRHYQNRVVFTLEPTESIKIQFWTKQPGFKTKIEERQFRFMLYEKFEKTQYVEEYSKLLKDACDGDQTLFVTADEVKAMWRFIDPILKAWHRNVVPLASYKPDTDDVFFQQPETSKPVTSNQQTSRQIGMIGLGKMGANFARRLFERNWQVVGFDPAGNLQLTKEGITIVESIKVLVAKLKRPRVIWLMVPAGKPVDKTIGQLVPLLSKGDTIIDGGNSFYKDTIKRAKRLKRSGISFIDVGVSGGPEGARRGASLMIGGSQDDFDQLQHLFFDLALPGGVQFFEGDGAGHFVKMIHNGIEYGMMQALAEGFTILKQSPFKLDLTRVADIYNHGSVIESRLVGWLKNALEIFGQDLKEVSGRVAHTGEGAWTLQTAKTVKLKARVIEEALKFRIVSQKDPSYVGKILTALRNQFGGHSVK